MKVVALLFFLLLLAIILAADQGRLPHFIFALYRFPGGDKVGQFVLMGLLAFFVNMAVPMRPVTRPGQSLLVATLMVAVLVTIEEASQGMFRTRTLSFADLFSSYAGIGLFSYGAWLLRRNKIQRTMT